ncbi:hypothetical protein GCM10007972_26030 [Iodidimonas muriae]|uniref:Uncharacterized protein n=1 Tax=Iodidimonas muriae TaxID=261467 RepID=A0ABQ2LGH1_9PROT|nr:hypothetical protein [Iodidimonas muriae]GER08531.1 hypothetical protein JCM17843_28410 [Kordiimonadales bacterium JCM 17843]GGO16688.1 hypothetical protein GCM10007972_26030 [Iodidimonas muriae]
MRYARTSGSMVRPLQSGLIAGLMLFAAIPLNGQAEDDPFAALTPMADEELEDARGGMRLGAFDIALGFAISSLVDGQPVAISNFSLNDNGQFVPVLASRIQAINEGAPVVVGADRIVIGADGVDIARINGAGEAGEASSLPLGTRIIENTLDGVGIVQVFELTVVMENMQEVSRTGRLSMQLGDIARRAAMEQMGN